MRRSWLAASLAIHIAILLAFFRLTIMPDHGGPGEHGIPVELYPQLPFTNETPKGQEPPAPQAAKPFARPPSPPSAKKHAQPPPERPRRSLPAEPPPAPAKRPESPQDSAALPPGPVPKTPEAVPETSGDLQIDETPSVADPGPAIGRPGPRLPTTGAIDKAVIARIGRSGKREVPTLSFQTEDLKYTTYLYRLKDQIESVWKYPIREGRLGIQGDLLIRFEITADGSLGTVELVRTSGYPALDQAALQALRDAAPFYPLPKKWEESVFPITGQFVYRSGSSYIR